MTNQRREGPTWPGWLENLRPDEVTRARLRRSIVTAAAPLLRGRQLTWWEVASDWASLLTPVAAAIAVLFAGLALDDRPTAGKETAAAAAMDTLRYEEFVEWASAEELPPAFPEDSLADLDAVLTSITSQP